MGYDEHGPAFPEKSNVVDFGRPPYRCPVCGCSETAYLMCNHPACPDGRDYGHPSNPKTYAPEPRRRPRVSLFTKIVLIWAVIATVMLLARPARSMDHGFDPTDKTVRWMESIQRPDQPGSCCGKGDAYPVSDYWDNHDGTWTAVIGDGSAKVYPDGTTRAPVPDGTKVIVAKEHVNKLEDDLDNPTDTSWIFMYVARHSGLIGPIFCLIRHPSGN